MGKSRGLGGKRIVRKSVSMDNSVDKKITRLAISCGMFESEFIFLILKLAMNSVDFINDVQDKYCVNELYRAIPIVNYETNEVEFE